MARNVELNAGEVVIKQCAADYWETLIGPLLSQVRGHYTFTNQRIYFAGGFTKEVEIPYSEITSVEKCNVGALIHFVPTGIKVTTKDGTKHRLSVLKRTQIMGIIEEQMKQCAGAAN